MATAQQEIVYRIKADNNQALQAFNDLSKAQGRVEQTTKKLGSATNQGNMMLMSTSRIIQDMPFGFMAVGNNITFLAEQFAYAKTQGMGFKDSLKGIFTSLMGTGGIIFAISTAVSVLTMMSTKTKSSSGEMKTFIDVLDKASKSALDMKKAFVDIDKQLKSMDMNFFEKGIMYMGVMTGLTPNALKDRIEDFKEILRQQGLLNAAVKEGDRIYELGSQMRGKTKDEILAIVKAQNLNKAEINSITKSLSEQQDRFPVYSRGYKEIGNVVDVLGSIFDKTKDKANKLKLSLDKLSDFGKKPMGGLDLKHLPFGVTPKDPFAKYFTGEQRLGTKPTFGFSDEKVKRDFLKENQMLVDTIKTSADVLRSEFSSAWQSIFGEADSLFEKLLMNISEKLTSNWLTKLGGGLLNWLVPGLGTAAGMAMGGNAPVIQNKIVISDREIATIYSMGREQASRLRI